MNGYYYSFSNWPGDIKNTNFKVSSIYYIAAVPDYLIVKVVKCNDEDEAKVNNDKWLTFIQVTILVVLWFDESVILVLLNEQVMVISKIVLYLY